MTLLVVSACFIFWEILAWYKRNALNTCMSFLSGLSLNVHQLLLTDDVFLQLLLSVEPNARKSPNILEAWGYCWILHSTSTCLIIDDIEPTSSAIHLYNHVLRISCLCWFDFLTVHLMIVSLKAMKYKYSFYFRKGYWNLRLRLRFLWMGHIP